MTPIRIGIITYFLIAAISGTASGEDVIYGKPFDLSVQARLAESPDGLFRVFPDEYDLDLNRDGLSDLRFRHTLTPRSRRVDADALNLLELAEGGIADTLNLVLGMRRVAIEAANEGVNDEDALEQLQAYIDNGIHTIERIATQPFGENGILDGSYGLQTTASSPFVEGISATGDTRPGTYAIGVTTRAERANVEAPVQQSSALFADETLVVNNVAVELPQGMTQSQVIDRINDFSSQTGVIAQTSQAGATQLYTEKFGTAATLHVISNKRASSDSSGFGLAKTGALGVDVVADFDANSYRGSGVTVTATGGDSRGLTLRVSEDFYNPVVSPIGALGTIDVTNNSPIFVVDEQSGESVSFTFPNILPAALGQGATRNQFVALDELKVRTAAQANDSLQIIDKTIDQLTTHHREILDFISLNAKPYGSGLIDGLNGAEFAMAEFGLFPGGIQVGRNLNYEGDSVLLQDSSVFRDLEQSGFVGVRVPTEDGWIHGWIGIEVEGDSSIQIFDYAWNTVSNENVITGVASNRSLDLLLAGDANMDGAVDFGDFLILSGNFGQRGRWHHGDFNHDQMVDFVDFLALSANFASLGRSASVPEPDTTALLALAMLFAGGCRARRGIRIPPTDPMALSSCGDAARA